MKMSVEYHKCDHCGKKLNEMVDFSQVEIAIHHLGFTIETKWSITPSLCNECFHKLTDSIADFVGAKVDTLPRKAVHVVRGHWVYMDTYRCISRYKCSNCERVVTQKESFCPRCGAEMDEEHKQ